MNKTCRQFPYRFTFESFIDNSSIPHPEKISRIFLRYPRYRSIYSINLLKPLERTSSVRRDYLNLLSTPQRSVQFLCGFHALTTCSAPNLPIVNSLPPPSFLCLFSMETSEFQTKFPRQILGFNLEEVEYRTIRFLWLSSKFLLDIQVFTNSKINPYDFVKPIDVFYAIISF